MVVVEATSEGATSVGKPIIDLSSVTTVGLDLAKAKGAWTRGFKY
jgi:hypothetical protein